MKSSITLSHHKISALAAAMATVLYTVNASAIQRQIHAPAGPSDSDNFTMLNGQGNTIGPDGGTNDVVTTWDGTVFTDSTDYTGPGSAANMTVSSSDPFFGYTWTAHDIQVFAPGSYSFDSAVGGGAPESGILNVTVPPNQLGIHMLFDWNGNNNIDVFIVVSPSSVFGAGIGRASQNTAYGNNCDGTTASNITNCLFDGKPWGSAGKPVGTQVWMLAPVDGDADGIMGIPMPAGGPFAGFSANFNFSRQGDANGIIAGGLAPLVIDDTVTAINAGGTANNINILANDVDVDNGNTGAITTAQLQGGSAGITISNQTGGTAVVNTDGTVTWTNSGAIGTDSFTYTLTDLAGNVSAQATVTIPVGVGSPPVANNDNLNATEDTLLTIDKAVDLIANDSDAEDANNLLSVNSFTQPPLGEGAITDQGATLLYTPPADFNGSTSFTYTISDSDGNSSSPATVTITVAAVNDPPVAQDDSASASFNQPVAVTVLGNDTDPDGDTLSVTAVNGAVNGTTIINADSSITYTPNQDFSGSDSFTYTVDDGNGGSAMATVNISVIGQALFIGTAVPDSGISAAITGGSSFTMLDATGGVVGGTNDVFVQWDGTFKNDVADTVPNLTLGSAAPTKFFGFVWNAHDARVFGPGSYTIESCPGGGADGSTRCTFPAPLQLIVGPQQLGIHILFDWGDVDPAKPCGVANCNIDVAQVMEINKAWAGSPTVDDQQSAKGTVFNLVSIDPDYDSDTIPGIRMPDGAFVGFNSNFNFNFDPHNQFALPTVSLQASQNGNPVSAIVPSGGPVTLTANAPAGATFDWNSSLLNQPSDASLIAANTNGTTSQTFVFDPTGLSDGLVTAKVTIRDPNKANLANYAALPMVVSSTTSLANATDLNGNRIPDGNDIGLPSTQIPAQPASNTFVLASDAGVLRLGTTALTKAGASGTYAVGITDADIGVTDSAVAGSCVGGCFDFEVTGITPGTSVNVVLPLDVAIPANASYRKFSVNEWHDYSLLGGDALASAPGGPGTCPAPGDAAYQSGLNEGDFCVQLSITDGGRNDADGTANGTIVDPGGVSGAAVVVGGGATIASDPPGLDQGGCSIGSSSTTVMARADWGLIGLLLGWLGISKRRRSQ